MRPHAAPTRLGGVVLLLVSSALGSASAQEAVDFDSDVLPLFEESCSGGFCHIGTPTAGVELTTWGTTVESVGDAYGGPIVVPFDPDASPLIDKLESDPPEHGARMPIGREPFTAEQLATVRRWVLEGARRAAGPAPERGDANADGRVDLDDALVVLAFLFEGTSTPACLPVADADGDRWLVVTDAIHILSYLFLGGPEPPPLRTEEDALCAGTLAS